MPDPSSTPRKRAGHAVWQAGDAATGVVFVGRGPGGDRAEILARVIGRPMLHSWARQVHGRQVLHAAVGCSGEGDALLTDQTDLVLTISTADCVPLIVAADRRLVAVHAGWRGVAAGIVGRAVAALAAQGAARAWIGPAIGGCCYEVGQDVAAAVTAAAGPDCLAAAAPEARPRLDLQTAVEDQLRAAGVASIATLRACTRCRQELHSYRRDGEAAGRNLAFGWRRGAS